MGVVKIRCFLAVFLVGAVLLAGCQQQRVIHAYQGEALPDARLSTLYFPESLEVIGVDNRKVRGVAAYFSGGSKVVKVPAGKHKVALYYDDLWDTGPDTHEVIKSRPVLVTLVTKAGDEVHFSHAPLKTVQDARSLMDDFEVVATNQRGEQFASEPAELVTRVETILMQTAPVLSDSDASRQAVASEPVPVGEPSVSGNAGHLNALKRHWQLASPEDRQAFQQWVWSEKK